MSVMEEPAPRGIDEVEIANVLAAAEPQRRAAFAATINLAVALGLAFSQFGWFTPPLLFQLLMGVMAATAVWSVASGLWRTLAIASLAPALGEDWGQTGFEAGTAAFDLERWFEMRGPGSTLTLWRSRGRYRDVDYELEERRNSRRIGTRGPARITYLIWADIGVPTSFRGAVEILPNAGIMDGVDAAVRRLFDDPLQPVSIGPEFDFTFYTLATPDAQLDALLTPAFQETMLNLARQHPETKFVAQFKHGRFRLQFPIATRSFSGARLHVPMPDLAHQAGELWWELTIPHRIIDSLMGVHRGRVR
jgi:hypothetical protein